MAKNGEEAARGRNVLVVNFHQFSVVECMLCGWSERRDAQKVRPLRIELAFAAGEKHLRDKHDIGINYNVEALTADIIAVETSSTQA